MNILGFSFALLEKIAFLLFHLNTTFLDKDLSQQDG